MWFIPCRREDFRKHQPAAATVGQGSATALSPLALHPPDPPAYSDPQNWVSGQPCRANTSHPGIGVATHNLADNPEIASRPPLKVRMPGTEGPGADAYQPLSPCSLLSSEKVAPPGFEPGTKRL